MFTPDEALEILKAEFPLETSAHDEEELEAYIYGPDDSADYFSKFDSVDELKADFLEYLKGFEADMDKVPSVYDYFTTSLGVEPADETLRELPVNTPCGSDCRQAIYTAHMFMAHCTKAGIATDSIVRMAFDVVQTYWHG